MGFEDVASAEGGFGVGVVGDGEETMCQRSWIWRYWARRCFHWGKLVGERIGRPVAGLKSGGGGTMMEMYGV